MSKLLDKAKAFIQTGSVEAVKEVVSETVAAPTENEVAETVAAVEEVKAEKKGGNVKARCIQRFSFNGESYSVNDVYTGSQEDVDNLKENGFVDAHPDAVAYAEGLK
jgi:hypothetical protein